MNEITNKSARTSATNNKNNNANLVSPSDTAEPAPELLLECGAAEPQQQLLFSPSFYYLTESDMRTILASCSDNACSNNTHHHGLEQLADHCLHSVRKETFLRAVCATGLEGVTHIILRNSNSPCNNDDDDDNNNNQDQYDAERIVRAGCVITSCVAVCARYKNFCQACHPTAATLLQAILQALHRFPHHPDIQRFSMATVSRMVKSTAVAVADVTGWCSDDDDDDDNNNNSNNSVSALLEDPIVAALQPKRDNDDDDLWLVLWALQAVKRLVRHNNNCIAAVVPVRMARRIQPLIHAILVRYNNNNNNNSTGELQGMILKEAWSALKHLRKLTA